MTNLPIMTHSSLTDDPAAGNIKKTEMPTLEKWMWISTDDDFSGGCHCLVVMMTVDSSDPGPGPAPGVSVSPRVRTPATTELSLRRPGQFMVSVPAWPAQTFAAGVQRSEDKKCNGELGRRGRAGDQGHSEQAVIIGRTTRHPQPSQDEKA